MIETLEIYQREVPVLGYPLPPYLFTALQVLALPTIS